MVTLKPFHSIGIGVAFSPHLKANLFEAARLAVFFKAKLQVIHVGDKTSYKVDALHDILAEFENEDLVYELVFQNGKPVTVILAMAASKNIDLLVLGAVQRERWLTYYMGSIARQITRKAKCAILLLTKPSVERVPCAHIVVNGLETFNTKHVIATAYYVGKQLDANTITIVEEIKEDTVTTQVDDDKALRRANIFKERLSFKENKRIKTLIDTIPKAYTEDITLKLQPIFGTKGYSIGHYAQIARADLLVMGAPKQTTFWERLFPRDLEHILSELPTDVLILQ
jgi:nucleotide-binding universal stress UspA family protein